MKKKSTKYTQINTNKSRLCTYLHSRTTGDANIRGKLGRTIITKNNNNENKNVAVYISETFSLRDAAKNIVD